GDTANGKCLLAVLDPESRGTAAVVAGHAVDTEADHVGDEQAALDVGHQLVGRELSLLEVEVRCPAARPMAGGLEVELSGRGKVEQPRRELAVVDHRVASGRKTVAVEWPAAEPALAVGIVDNADALGENLLTHLVLQEGRAARHGPAVDGAGEMTDQSAG